MPQTFRESFQPSEPDRPAPEGTRLESVEDLRQALQNRRVPTAPAPAEEAHQDTIPFKPVLRPPMAVLCVVDDEGEDGEWIRLRADRFVIGRTKGDLVIPHDNMMSSQHAQLVRHNSKGRYRWYLEDLKSTNGSFVRASQAILHDGLEILLGGRRYRFDQGAAQAEAKEESAPAGTRGWKSLSTTDLLPSLVEIKPEGLGDRFFLDRAENWIGRDPQRCTVLLENDRMVSPCHARIHRDAKGDWRLENAGSRNGVWIRVSRLPIEGTGQFQLGEQRFVLRTQ